MVGDVVLVRVLLPSPLLFCAYQLLYHCSVLTYHDLVSYAVPLTSHIITACIFELSL